MQMRQATYAGVWYPESRAALNSHIEGWMEAVDTNHAPARAIIVPHAGYRYIGACSAFAYAQVSTTNLRRVFILGPSHHEPLRTCALSTASSYSTPFKPLLVDQDIYAELRGTGQFIGMEAGIETKEHSIEMQLPFIAKLVEDSENKVTIVPVLVGFLSLEQESMYGRIFQRYLGDPENLFVISSDLCHWGERFRYTYYEKEMGPISKFIAALDRSAMDAIESLNPTAFRNYLEKYDAPICGRHAISILLQATHFLRSENSKTKFSLKFLRYTKSNQCHTMLDSSVSYGAASLALVERGNEKSA